MESSTVLSLVVGPLGDRAGLFAVHGDRCVGEVVRFSRHLSGVDDGVSCDEGENVTCARHAFG